MGYTGPDAVDWVTQMARPRYKGPCVVSEFIALPAAVKAVEEEQGKFNGNITKGLCI
jgi:hypothetical protein